MITPTLRTWPRPTPGAPAQAATEATPEAPDAPDVAAFLAFLNGGEFPPDPAFVRDMFAAQERYRATLEVGLARASNALVDIAEHGSRAFEVPVGAGQESARGYQAGVYAGVTEAAKLIQRALNEAANV